MSTYSGRAVQIIDQTMPLAPGQAEQWPPRHHWPPIIAACALGAVAVLLLTIYGLEGAGWGRPASSLLLSIGLSALVCAGYAGLTAYSVWANDKAIAQATDHGVSQVPSPARLHAELEALACRLRVVVEQHEEELADVPDRVAEQVRLVETATAGALGHVAAEMQAIREVLPAVVARVEELERAVEEQDEEYERGWLAGARKTAEALTPGNGQVRRLVPPAGLPPEPRRPAG